MNASAYSEDQMLQAGTAEFFEEHLGWRTEYAFEREDYGPASLLGRAHRGETVLVRELRKALKKLNPKAPAAAIEAAIQILVADDAGKNLVQINEDKHRLLLNGVEVEVRDEAGRLGKHVLLVIDFKTPEDNDFLMVRELWVQGLQPRRAALVGFVNGLPLLFVELKRYDKDVKLGFDKNLADYNRDIRHLFFFNAFVVLSNGHDALFGSITSPWEHFYRWRRLNEVDPMPPKAAPLLQTLLRGMGSQSALLDIVQNFVVFDHGEGARDLGVEVEAVGDDEEGILPAQCAPYLAHQEHHRIGLAAALSVPIDAELARIHLGANGGIVRGQPLDDAVDAQDLVVARHDLGRLGFNREKDAAEIARIFEQLMALDRELDDEEHRFVREGFDNDEQLAIFDLLQKDALKPAEIERIKQAAKALLPALEQRRVLAEYWKERATSRAQVETAILDHFYAELPEEAFSEDDVRLLSAKVFGLLMRPGNDQRLH